MHGGVTVADSIQLKYTFAAAGASVCHDFDILMDIEENGCMQKIIRYRILIASE